MGIENDLNIRIIIEMMIFVGAPLLWWRVSTKGDVWFFQWVGLERPAKKSQCKFRVSLGILFLYVLLALNIHALIFPNVIIRDIYDNIPLGLLVISGIFNVVPFAVTMFFQEIFFRGFIGKRLIDKLGFFRGNSVQALIYMIYFAILSGFDFIIAHSIYFLLLGTFGWLVGYVTEKQAGGSIIPAFITYTLAMYNSVFLYILIR